MTLMNPHDYYIPCPYDKSHSIIMSRLQTHLCKCAKNNKEIGIVACPFNAAHRVNRNELVTHVKQSCSDRSKVERFLYQNEAHSQPLIQPQHITIQQTSNENWDDDNFETYDPQKVCETKPILRYYQGGTPSERKLFRMEERQRFSEFFEPQDMKMLEDYGPTRFPNKAPGVLATTEPGPSTKISDEIKVNKLVDKDGFQVVPCRGRGRGRFMQRK